MRYAYSFSKKKGRRAKTMRVALGALIIKDKLNLTDEEDDFTDPGKSVFAGIFLALSHIRKIRYLKPV